MKKIASSLVAVALIGHLLSCSLNPAWILNPDASDWDRKSGLRLDTARNRAGLTSDYLSFIEREMAGEERDWGATWKGIFEALDRAEANPGFYKNWVIQERRKRGLPELKF